MSLPREWSLQDSNGSFYYPPDPTKDCKLEYRSGELASMSIPTAIDATPAASGSAIIAGSQPTVAKLLSNDEHPNHSSSLFSIHSAPPVPLTELGCIQQNDNLLGFGCTGNNFDNNSKDGCGYSKHEIKDINACNLSSTIGTDKTNEIMSSAIQNRPQRPGTLAIDGGNATKKTLHANFLHHQISEIEEDDNENLLTVSSITARPLIAKSRELRSSRLLAEKQHQQHQQKRKNKKECNIACKTINNNLSSSASSASAEPPDGGYGWFIVFGAFFVQFWVAGLVKSYGVLYVEILETFPNTSATVASWIPAILSCLCLALAPLSSALCQRFSCRKVVFIGGLFCAFGLTLSYFATSLLQFMFTFSILTGIGGGLSTTPGIVIVSQYFDKHRALANGICVSGTAAGSFILPVLIKHLVYNFGFHGTILILGGCMLHVCVSATLYKPIESKDDDDDDDDDDEIKPKFMIHQNGEVITKSLTDVNLNGSNNGCTLKTNSTYLDSYGDDIPDKKFIEHLFLEESKNRINDFYNTNKFINANDKSIQLDISDDEGKDIVGETTFMKPIKSVRSSSILHSVEDLSTDSTWVYRKSTDLNRSSRRHHQRNHHNHHQRNAFCNDELISKIHANLEKKSALKQQPSGPAILPISPPMVQSPEIPTVTGLAATKGLSKSMEIPTPASNFCDDTNNYCRNDDNDDDDIDINVNQSCCDRLQTYLDISLLKDSTFILMSLSVTLMSVGCPYMLYYLPAHVISIGYSKSEAGFLVAVSAGLDLIGRLGLGWLSDLKLFDRKKTYIICILGAGSAVLTIPSATSIYSIGCSAAIYGFCLGCWYLLMPVLLADLFGTDRISSSYGLVRMFQSIGAISVPPLAGYLSDLSGSYVLCFYCMGSCMICGSIPLLIWAIIKQKNEILFTIRDDIEDNSSVS